MSDLLPEKIWYQHRTEPHNLPSYNAHPAGLDTVEYIRSDLMDAKIESLQRENQELKADQERWVRIAQTRQDALNAARKEINEMTDQLGWIGGPVLKPAAAITPEMREIAAEYAQHERHEPLRLFLLDIAGVLREQGGMGDE